MNHLNYCAGILSVLSLFASTASCGNLTTDAAIGGGLGGAIGGALGAQVGGKQGAVLGAGLGAAAGASLNTKQDTVARPANRGRVTGYSDDDDDRYRNSHHKQRDFCPPGQAKKGNC